MMRGRTGLVLGLAAVAVVVSARLTLRAQDEPKGDAVKVEAPKRAAEPLPEAEANAATPAAPTVQDALLRPFPIPFGEPTRLDDACRHLGRVLKAPVVLDLAAIDRLGLRADDTVQLELEGVRLKTGLKLLLDQVGLTYKVIPEDNLLIVTDQAGSEDPLDRVQAELKALHRDIHDIQDELDYLREDLGLDEGGPKMRKPTIIEEMPPGKGEGGAKPEPEPADPGPKPEPSRSRPGS